MARPGPAQFIFNNIIKIKIIYIYISKKIPRVISKYL
jgi:hypothetical protein